METCGVCIVGAGAAGLVLAACLVRRGVAVTVLEVGGRICADGRAVGIEAVVEGGVYRATAEGRAFGLGGTTALWGGQLVPHSELDFRPAQAGEAFDPWRQIVGAVERHARDVAAMLGLTPEADWFKAKGLLPAASVDALRSRGLETVAVDSLPFRKRNLAFLVESLKGARGELSVFLNAPGAAWDIQPASDGSVRVVSVTARSGGRALTVTARAFVLAAGAIESTRILLEMERQCGARLFPPGAAVGRYLADHLSCRIADVPPDDYARCSQNFGPRFRAGRMRSFRFVERLPPPDAPRCFFHFIYDNQNEGFLLAKKALLGLQSQTIPRISLGEAARGISGLAGLAWNRFIRARLYIPNETPCHLQLDIEQSPDYANCVTLSDALDAAGRPKAVVRWNVRVEDYQAIRAAAARFIALWPVPSSVERPEHGEPFPRLAPAVGDAPGPKPHDVYHPVGTCRMGVDPEAVVDPELAVRGVANLSVLSTAVFPSAGTANPTFSMLCLGAALAEKLK